MGWLRRIRARARSGLGQLLISAGAAFLGEMVEGRDSSCTSTMYIIRDEVAGGRGLGVVKVEMRDTRTNINGAGEPV